MKKLNKRESKNLIPSSIEAYSNCTIKDGDCPFSGACSGAAQLEASSSAKHTVTVWAC